MATQTRAPTSTHASTPTTHPQESFVHPPRVPPSPADHVFGREHMVHFYDVPGEYGYVMEGKDHGFSDISIIITDTEPGGGPPLHVHETEEAQVLQAGRYRVLIGDDRYDVTGPAIVRIPAGVPHAFVNIDDRAIHVVGVFPGEALTYEELGPNPLLDEPGSHS